MPTQIFEGSRKIVEPFAFGTPSKIRQISNLRPDQEALSNQLVQAGQSEGAGGAFGTAADYYRNLLSDNPADMQTFSAPAMRQFNQEIIPGISEQFAGMGAGGLSSSGFRNSANQAGVDLAERLGQIRANLRQQGAQGLQNIGQLGLQNFQQNYEQPGTEGFLSAIAPVLGGVIGTAVGGPIGGAIGTGAGNFFGGKSNQVGANSSPYGGGSPQASPQITSTSKASLPNFLQGTGTRGY
ncbi:hypothetical protein UFOVP264_16 [uncultured Caudovirales phage]|uniref:Uncharacterized protein n=1 Tax=uncultured Caudovirales phage TaxID=2100421 RepID=A0A6J5LKX5_9CAUD|nr:hypothetical protein UFOVP264_16 [uncultured Caudovirales phage]